MEDDVRVASPLSEAPLPPPPLTREQIRARVVESCDRVESAELLLRIIGEASANHGVDLGPLASQIARSAALLESARDSLSRLETDLHEEGAGPVGNEVSQPDGRKTTQR